MNTARLSGRSTAFRVVLLFGLVSACTRLFGDRENTLAPLDRGELPNLGGVPELSLPEEMAGVLCAPGEARCDGALLQACASDGGSWLTLERCPGAALCQAEPPLCLDAACGPGEMTCDGATLLLCNQERNGWEVFDTCASPAHCNADERQCTDAPCTPGDRRCNRSESRIPVIDRCRDDQADWDTVTECATRDLCEQTLAGALGGLALQDGTIGLAAPVDESTIVSCNAALCEVGQVRCDGAQLERCNDGRTGWALAEQCGTPGLCESSLANRDAAGNPRCLVAQCASGTHQCTEVGALQVCNEERSGFRTISTCIGPAFCNALLADQGENGCTSAPCEAGTMQCNGPQIQRCRDDRTGFDDVGVACETAALCNDDDTANAFCADPACRRGALSGDEFACQGTSLDRCNEEFTGYASIATCATPALCDAGRGFEGCLPPVCAPGQHACNGTFLAQCNADQTGFDDLENCGSAGQCDANAGRCADPVSRARCAATARPGTWKSVGIA